MVIINKVVETTPLSLRYIIPDDWSEEEKEANPIAAKKVVDAIKSGKKVEIINAVIEGPLILRSIVVDGEVSIQRTKIKSSLDWSYAVFKQVVSLESSIFESDAIFIEGSIEKDLFLDNVTFHGNVIFQDITVNGVLYSRCAIFRKNARFIDATFKRRVEFDKSIFQGDVNFKGVQIKGTAVFTGVKFKQKCNFISSKILDAAFFNLVIFEDEADFGQAWIGGLAQFEKTIFNKRINFNTINIEKNAIFRAAIFEGDAIFKGSCIKGIGAEFDKAKFKKKADFTSSHIYGGALFNSVIFEGMSDFRHVKIGNYTVFNDTKFKQEAIFNSSQMKGTVYFNSVIFEKNVDFGQVWIGSYAEFDKANFKQKVSFNTTQIEGHVFFKSAIFEGEADFTGSQIGGIGIVFYDAKFKQNANFIDIKIKGNAIFNSAIFEGDANFGQAQIGSAAQFDRTKFQKVVNFHTIKVEGNTSFQETVFAEDIVFKNASLNTVFFEKPLAKFNEETKIDLRGCIYNEFHPFSFWVELMKHLEPYDRQPFTQLEETFRRSGKDELANDVYYERKKLESSQKTIRNPIPWLTDRFLYLLTGYGIKLYRLFIFIIFILLVGTCIFLLGGGIEPNSIIQPPPIIGFWEAFWVSLNTFLPVEIPSGTDWTISSQIIPVLGIKFTTFATLLKLAGWIFVPIGVAGISGILKR